MSSLIHETKWIGTGGLCLKLVLGRYTLSRLCLGTTHEPKGVLLRLHLRRLLRNTSSAHVHASKHTVHLIHILLLLSLLLIIHKSEGVLLLRSRSCLLLLGVWTEQIHERG